MGRAGSENGALTGFLLGYVTSWVMPYFSPFFFVLGRQVTVEQALPYARVFCVRCTATACWYYRASGTSFSHLFFRHYRPRTVKTRLYFGTLFTPRENILRFKIPLASRDDVVTVHSQN